ncbi:hypothetical protein CASFOL_015604 [Castilleja foliolosa]|uniref:DDT domain-containing protein n=1 Tax=Castilleja foliolosa TaxID=1961234 RepID=A0ABD3DG89_9LAMI
MQTLDLPCNSTVDPPAPDPSAMPGNSSPIHSQNDNSSKDGKTHVKSNSSSVGKNIESSNSVVVRRERPSRACTQRAAARLQAAAEAEAALAETERKRKRAKREKTTARVVKEESEEEDSFEIEDEGVEEHENGEEGGGSPSSSKLQCSKIVTPLVGELEPAQLPRWNIRSMWQLASIFNFLNVFRDLLNIKVEFSAEEFETALITPNNTLGDVHIPLLKAIPPVTRMALGHNTWVTVLCRKLRDWWHWVAEGDLPIVASHGAEIETYNTFDPEVRVVILKALCDIRVEQEDIRSYIDDSIKRGVHLSLFRKERIGGGCSSGVSYWYEDDPIIGHRLYREIRNVEVNKGKGRNVAAIPHSSYEWETVATNFDEFMNVSEKLFSSKNRTEVAVGKKLKNNMLPEIEKVHKRKEKLLKKQHRQALMLDNMMNMDGLIAGRSLRDRKPVTYTFDDYDRSINEAIKVTKKKQLSPEPYEKREHFVKIEGSSNGGSRWDDDNSPSQYHPRHDSFTAVSANSLDNDDDYDDNEDEDGYYDDQTTETLDRSNRRRQKPRRYSANDFVERLSDNDPDFESDDEIVGEVVYDEEYLRKRNNKKRKTSSSSESEEEYRWNDENHEEEEEDDDNDSLNTDDDDSDNPKPRKFKSMSGPARRGTKLRSVDELQSGLRRSKRATRNQINYSHYELSESENELTKHGKSDALDEQRFDESDNDELSMGSQDLEQNNMVKEDETMIMPEYSQPLEEKIENVNEKQTGLPPEEEFNSRDQEESGDGDGVGKRRFLDLNELAPGPGFDDGPASTRRDDEDGF